MKKLATYVVAGAVLIGTPAFAADIPVKAPPSPPAPVYSWTGWYVGVNAGVSFGHVKTDWTTPVTLALNATPGSGPGSATADFAGSSITEPSGIIGGGQIGYNWQYSPVIVVGLEADFQGADERDRITLTNNSALSFTSPSGFNCIQCPVSAILDFQTKIDWFGTARGRIGYVWGNGQVLSYVTGGLAYGRVDVEETTVSRALAVSITQAIDHSQVNTGWTIGTGTEGKLLIPGWTYKIEALYMDLGHVDTTTGLSSSSISVAGGGGITFTQTGTAGQTTHSHFTDTILRAGLNYQFH